MRAGTGKPPYVRGPLQHFPFQKRNYQKNHSNITSFCFYFLDIALKQKLSQFLSMTKELNQTHAEKYSFFHLI